MSDNYLRFVPADARWRPGDEGAAAAVSLVRSLLPAAEAVEFESEDAVTFFDAGANSESVACPFCGNDLEEWWGQAIGEAYESGFESLAVTTPCCGRPTSLNDLVYKWPAAFGKCAIAVRNPGLASLGEDALEAIELAIGAPLKLVWTHL